MGNKKRTSALFLLSALLYLFPSYNTYPQQESFALISGRVIDEETNRPVEDAIVFLANTFRGTSTDTLGYFMLSNIEPGEYDLIISRVGYSRRTKHVRINKNDSLFYDIRLTIRPIQTGEVEISAERPDNVKPKLNLLFPTSDNNSYCLYGMGESLPIGILFGDSAIFMYALDTAIVEDEKYLRLWLLYYNLMKLPFDFIPYDCIKINVRTQNQLYKNIMPELPTETLLTISNEDVSQNIMERIDQTVQTLQLFQYLIKPGYIRSTGGNIDAKQGTTYDFSGKMEVNWDFQKDPALKGASTEFISSIYYRSVNDGILKRHIVYSKNGVHGFIYFPYPGLNWQVTSTGFTEAFENQYELEIRTPTEIKIIVFTAH